ncbi:hypothetical protein B0E42_21975 [Pseudomonas sp. A25(2017)]|uniref:SnoaL-like domain-containing protein n=1 Tax=Pseudomonas kilonensis TaxID=132476 RepID=A0ABY0ZHD1_9PSED|nr:MULTISPECIES: nuclear transport factor 2 family protein [Pseudomonas]OOG82511.1 hypothetical protein B0E42_21975 [Pseudomonas sp. A25(2017)]SEE68893.1 SnoaL-like domain-containing protein [Pseudomonas kilonensis]
MSSQEHLLQRIEQLETRLVGLEDIEQIKRLQRMYGYYIDNRLWTEMAELFSDSEAVMEIGQRGRYLGKHNIEQFLLDVLGQGRSGLLRDEFINHMQLQGVVTLGDDGKQAQGRWRALIQGNPPPGSRSLFWAEGVYENTYVKEAGTWKIARLWWVPTFYTTHPCDSLSFASTPASASLPPQQPSAEPDSELGRTFVPFHYQHPITGQAVTRVTSKT